MKADQIISEKLKNRLYPVVLELFAENDFHRVNIREISNLTGISSGTIYRYFSSKEDLIFTILDEKISEIGSLIELHIGGMENLKEIFRKIFWVTMDFYDNNPGVAVTAFITVPMRTWMKEKSFKRFNDHAILYDVLKNARKKGNIDPLVSNRQLIDLYYMFCYRHIHNWYFYDMKWNLADTIDDFFNFFWNNIKTENITE